MRPVQLRGRGWAPSTHVVGLVVGSVVAQGALAVSGPLGVRVLGVEGRGELAVLVSISLLMSQLGSLGVPAAFAFFIARDRVSATAYLRRFGLRYLAVAAVVSTLAVGLLSVVAGEEELHLGFGWSAVIVVVGTASVLATVMAYGGLQGEHRFGVFAVLQCTPAVLYASSLVVLLSLGVSGVAVVALVFFAGWAVVAVVGLTASWWRTAPGYDRRGEPVRGTELRSYAARAALATAAPIDGLNVDQVLVGLLLTRYDLGLYVIGYAFATACAAPFVAVAPIVAPRLAAAPRALARAAAVRWLLLAAAAAVVGVALVQLMVGTVLPWAFGDAARPAVDVARILILTGAALGLRRVGAAVLLGLGAPGRGTVAELVGFAVLLVAFPIATRYGVSGAAWALCTAATVSIAVQLGCVARTLRQPSQPPVCR